MTHRRGAAVATRACILLVALVGCDPGGRRGGEGSVTFEPSDVHVLGTSESIATVRDLAVAADGSVWVLNSVEPLFVGFAPDGGILGSHGTAGGGPDEFRTPAGFVAGGLSGDVWVFDSGRNTFVRVSGPGSERSELALPRENVPPGTVIGGILMTPTVRTARLGEEVILPRTTATMDAGVLSFVFEILGADLAALRPCSEPAPRV